MIVKTIRSSNVRAEPEVNTSNIIGLVGSGRVFEVDTLATGQSVGGNDQWYEVKAYIHSGQVQEVVAGHQPTGLRLTHWPAQSRMINQVFGANPQNYAQFGLPGHDGVDIRARDGDQIFAAAAGKVISINRDPDASAYGYYIRLEHEEGYTSLYAHLRQEPTLAVGDTVEGGQLVGYAGSTGNSSGPHLHFGMKGPFGQPNWPHNIIDPMPFLAAL